MVLTVSFVLFPVIGLCCHRRQRECAAFIANLNASVEASEPHDFAVRKPAPSSEAPPASTASRPALVTIAIRPFRRNETAESIKLFLANREAINFLAKDWTAT
jgi:hypothetical protein